MATGKLYLIPTFLGENNPDLVPPEYVKIIHQISHFIAEHAKSARAFLKVIGTPVPMNDLQIDELNKHTNPAEINQFLQPCLNGMNMGLMSDAGLPCVADPGYQIVRLAHKHQVEVIPFHGLSSVMMTLMASGLNGQQFRFHGYLSHDKDLRRKTLRNCLDDLRKGETQLFIETPYRNRQFVEELAAVLPAETVMVIGIDLSLPSQQILRFRLKDRPVNLDDLHKRPAVFALGQDH